MVKKEKKYNIEVGGGMGFASTLTLIFVVFKLMGYINWSWWWVLCPLWIGIAIALGILALALFIGACFCIGAWLVDRKW